MKQKSTPAFCLIFSALLMLSFTLGIVKPGVVFGQSNSGSQQPANGGTQQPSNPGGQQPSIPANCKDPNSCLYNPLPEEELTHVFLVVIQGFLAIVGIWAVIFIIVGGFQMVMGAGNEETYLKAKKTILWAVLGLIIALLSFSVVAIVENLLQADIKPTNASQSLRAIVENKYL